MAQEHPLERATTLVPLISGPTYRRKTVRVALDSDGGPQRLITVEGTPYEAQRGPNGWEYIPVPKQRGWYSASN